VRIRDVTIGKPSAMPFTISAVGPFAPRAGRAATGVPASRHGERISTWGKNQCRNAAAISLAQPPD
jgi:hypothetical protein